MCTCITAAGNRPGLDLSLQKTLLVKVNEAAPLIGDPADSRPGVHSLNQPPSITECSVDLR